MSMRTLGWLFLIALGPVLAADPVLFNSRASAHQTVSLENVSSIVIRCYCVAYSVTRSPNAKDLALDIAGTYNIGGYHGSKENAGADPLTPVQLEFRVKRNDGALTVDSPEWIYIHHSLIIDSVNIVAPQEGAIRVDQLSFMDLVNRSVK